MGAIADLLAFDPHTDFRLPLETLHDLPCGATRLVSRSTAFIRLDRAANRRAEASDLDATPGRLVRSQERATGGPT